ncbi:hypothetical protein D3C73_1038300 [compost metagenome]
MRFMDEQLVGYEQILNSNRSFPEKTKAIMLMEVNNMRLLSEGFLPTSSTEVHGLTAMMETYSEEKVLPFFIQFVAMGKREGFIHQDQTEEMAMLYFNMFKNELVRIWTSTNQSSVSERMNPLIELFFYGLVGQPIATSTNK